MTTLAPGIQRAIANERGAVIGHFGRMTAITDNVRVRAHKGEAGIAPVIEAHCRSECRRVVTILARAFGELSSVGIEMAALAASILEVQFESCDPIRRPGQGTSARLRLQFLMTQDARDGAMRTFESESKPSMQLGAHLRRAPGIVPMAA